MLGKSRSGRIPFCTKISRCQFCNPFCFFFWISFLRKNLGGRFSYWKNDHWSIVQKGKCARANLFGRDAGGGFFLHRDCRFVQIGFYLHRVRRPSARSEDGRVRRMVASGEFSRQEFGWARVFATQRSRIRGDWILSTQRLPIHWSLRDSLGDDIVFFIPDANKISSSFSCRFFLS